MIKIIGLDGKEYKWHIGQYNRQRPVVSSGHGRARELLKEIFPTEIILEELTLPGTGRSPLYADFYLNGPKLMVEVHGKQHFEYNQHYHGSIAGFMKSKARDNKKFEWCEINGIDLVILKDTDTDDRWREQINGR